MEFQRPLCLFFLLFSLLLSSSQANKFYVGGSKGWVPNPSESYNLWAGRNRFQIKDTIVFKYNKGSDSVLEVKKEDFDKCDKTNPIKKFEDGDTEFTLDRSGPFYFISGKDGNCEKGQKMLLVVLSPRGTQPPPKATPPSGSPSPAGTPPSVLPSPPSVSPSPSPISTPPAGGPSATSPAPEASSPSPISTPPAGGPSANSPAPGASSPSPTSAPPAGGPTATSPSPAGGPPAPSPTTGDTPTASGPGSSPSGSLPADTPSSNNSATPPSGNSGSSVAPSSFLRYSVTIVAGAALLCYGTVLG